VNPGRAYTSTVTSKSLLVASIAMSAVLGLVPLLLGGPRPYAIVVGTGAALAACAAGVHQATVRLAVGNGRIVLGQGPWRWPNRAVPFDLVTRADSEYLSLRQVFGLGIPSDRLTTRMTVRPGPTLVLSLTGGEVVRVSTPRPDGAIAVINPCSPVAPNIQPPPGGPRYGAQ
jgi:hypothetical protein